MRQSGQLVGVAALVAVLFLCVPLSAHADLVPIPTLYNTGVGGGGVLGNNAADGHYTVTRNEGGVSNAEPYAWRNTGGGWPIAPDGPWLADTSTSAWISPYLSVNPGYDTDPYNQGTYVYRTSFNLSGADLDSVSIQGRWSTDNDGAQILLNGVNVRDLLGSNYTTPNTAFTNWFDFAITSGFVSGVNTLSFVVNNTYQTSGNPTGLRVEMTGTADWGGNAPPLTVPVPEPASLLLLGAGLAGLAAMRMRKESSAD